ncbi:MAG: type IV pilus modification protein PilV [Porticoccaceae bacterium]|nr:type IV pilus modification protein PilV [Porticoccaceae bacterium]
MRLLNMLIESRRGERVGMRYLQQGVGLIEVLIAVLVLSVGILGVAALQITGKQALSDASQRSVATGLARDIAERMRSNPSELESYETTLGGGTITEPSTCRNSNCTTAQLAARDLFEWEQLLDGADETVVIGGVTTNTGGLVNPRACITHTLGKITVAIAWRGTTDQLNPTTSTCGESVTLYDTDNVRRRLLVINTYIATLS